jgi:hypothetical protein
LDAFTVALQVKVPADFTQEPVSAHVTAGAAGRAEETGLARPADAVVGDRVGAAAASFFPDREARPGDAGGTDVEEGSTGTGGLTWGLKVWLVVPLGGTVDGLESREGE